jgi:hypothetical protein
MPTALTLFYVITMHRIKFTIRDISKCKYIHSVVQPLPTPLSQSCKIETLYSQNNNFPFPTLQSLETNEITYNIMVGCEI